ncbi:hypothetical protein V5F38_01095 [Xanthobacter sp. V0B-10]|uniref:hypothetical protein n=1 Tax=Xanthobacter albus TaxID=3119929 RepID=UPI00372816DB
MNIEDAQAAELAAYYREVTDAEDFIEVMLCLNIPFTADEDFTEFQVQDLTYYPGVGRILREGDGLLAARGLDAVLGLLGRSRAEIPPMPEFNPGPWGPFGPPKAA